MKDYEKIRGMVGHIDDTIHSIFDKGYRQGYEDGSKSAEKTGHWIETDNYDPCWYMCSECHRRTDDKSDYCPNCGAKMEVGE